MKLLYFLLPLLTQVTVTSTGIQVADSDVTKVMSSLTSWTGSLFNVIIAFVGVIIAIWIVKLILKFVKKD